MYTVERDAESGEFFIFVTDDDGAMYEQAGPFNTGQEANNAALVLNKRLDSDIPAEEDDTALDVQIGGSHYKAMAIQPIEFTLSNNLGYCEGNVIKYVCRYKDKGGIEDINKAIHYLELLKESIDNG